MIIINNLKFDYGKDFVLDISELHISEDFLHVIIGPNGSGKSTFAKILSGLLKNYTGKIKIDELNISEMKDDALSRKITYMNRRLIRNYDISVFEFVSLGRFPHKKDFLFELKKEDIDIISQKLSDVDLVLKKDKMLYELSDGEIQRAYLAKTLCQETKYVILDEPTVNLDIKHIKEFLNLIESLKLKTTFIVILHDLNEALAIFDKLIAFNNGKIEFIWNKQKDFDLQKLKNLYKINIKCLSDNGRHVVYL